MSNKFKFNFAATTWLPPGIHESQIVSVTFGRSSSGLENVTFKCRIISGLAEGRLITQSYHTQGDHSAHLATFLANVDETLFQQVGGEVDLESFVGKMCKWEVMPKPRECKGRLYQSIYSRPIAFVPLRSITPTNEGVGN